MPRILLLIMKPWMRLVNALASGTCVGCYSLAAVIIMSAMQLSGGMPDLLYLGEIRPLQDRPAASVDLKIAKAVAAGSGVVISGHNDRGRLWTATLPIGGGMNWTRAWIADFDRNSRRDLMLVASFPVNGRCVHEGTVSFLMIDKNGDPVPWIMKMQLTPESDPSWRKPPLLFFHLNDPQPAQLLRVDCEPTTTPERFGQDFHLNGVYEAENASWKLIRPSNVRPYATAGGDSYIFDRQDRWVTPDPRRWPDFGNASQPFHRALQISAVRPADPKCQEWSIGRIVGTGPGKRIIPRAPDPECDMRGSNRLVLSDGTTCYGWPTIVLDQANRRSITAPVSEPQTEAILKEIARQHLPVSLSGQADATRCSPVILWAFGSDH